MVGVESQTQPLLTPSQEDQGSGAQQGVQQPTLASLRSPTGLWPTGAVRAASGPRPTQDPAPLTQPSQDFGHMLVRGAEKQGKS